eukprot:CAMPEP_0204175726 /NCGR_PEP_ID=MMETSP0361-20130328/47007_1 /ASSEMBLY_ACC=CAM_ASM_000343 /TAXON_ID=268821 /ORGANISM="Scrippsiella Hangoei, Strain SHTV-5" /LENGTH=402 /DNA_ID=CAMNT_0051134415 /DNA_START=1 /DNA_END=1206 /DNA_ORIENTATION=+
MSLEAVMDTADATEGLLGARVRTPPPDAEACGGPADGASVAESCSGSPTQVGSSIRADPWSEAGTRPLFDDGATAAAEAPPVGPDVEPCCPSTDHSGASSAGPEPSMGDTSGDADSEGGRPGLTVAAEAAQHGAAAAAEAASSAQWVHLPDVDRGGAGSPLPEGGAAVEKTPTDPVAMEMTPVLLLASPPSDVAGAQWFHIPDADQRSCSASNHLELDQGSCSGASVELEQEARRQSHEPVICGDSARPTPEVGTACEAAVVSCMPSLSIAPPPPPSFSLMMGVSKRGEVAIVDPTPHCFSARFAESLSEDERTRLLGLANSEGAGGGDGEPWNDSECEGLLGAVSGREHSGAFSDGDGIAWVASFSSRHGDSSRALVVAGCVATRMLCGSSPRMPTSSSTG